MHTNEDVVVHATDTKNDLGVLLGYKFLFTNNIL